MLLDRKRIKKWGKWVALALAIVFALSFLFMGVGYGGGGLSALFRGDTSTTKPPAKINLIPLQTLQADQNDTTTMLAIATLYEMYRAARAR